MSDKKDAKRETYIESLLDKLTLQEKIKMVHGDGFFHTGAVERLSIPALYMTDGPCGVRNEFQNAQWLPIGLSNDFVSYLPSNTAIASTWNRDLAYESGKVLGEEVRGRGKDVSLAPGINIKRSPLCGRNFEYMSEDPYLVREMAVPVVKGIQEADVASCVKHFAVNNQETDRLNVDTIVDERTLHEIYLPGFEAAVKEGGAYSIMNAYNKINGKWCGENKELLDGILRDNWGFDGCVISDWGSIHSTEMTANVSMDVEMSVTPDFDDYYLAKPYEEAILQGEVSEETLNAKVRNILRMMYRLKMIGEEQGERKRGSYNTFLHQEKALEVARESVVLLKNEGQILPISDKIKKLAVIGQNATIMHAFGGGSAEIKALYEISPLMGISKMLGGNTKISFAPGYFIPQKENNGERNWQEASLDGIISTKKSDGKDDLEEVKRLRNEAVSLAKEADAVIYVGGITHDFDVEGRDRENMDLPYHQDELIRALLEERPDSVIVMMAGSPVDMSAFADKAKALLWLGYAGMEGGDALAEILFGKVNPSGKLAETFPKHLSDCYPSKLGEFGREGCVEYKDGIYVGYRYFDTFDVEPCFPFGHGLSYTSFVYGKPVVECDMEKKTVRVRVSVTNQGKMAGKEIVQLYVTADASKVERPKKELKGFEKIFLEAGQTKEVVFTLGEDAFAYYDVETHGFVSESGSFTLHLGSSSRDIRQSACVER